MLIFVGLKLRMSTKVFTARVSKRNTFSGFGLCNIEKFFRPLFYEFFSRDGTKKNLQSNSDVVFLTADEGNATVVLDSDEYISKVNVLLIFL